MLSFILIIYQKRGGTMAGIEPTDDELFAIRDLTRKLQSQYCMKPKDLKIIGDYKRAIIEGMNKIGFKVEVLIDEDLSGNWIPVCDIIGRTDTVLQEALAKETDFERKSWDATKRTAADLQKQGVNLKLLD